MASSVEYSWSADLKTDKMRESCAQATVQCPETAARRELGVYNPELGPKETSCDPAHGHQAEPPNRDKPCLKQQETRADVDRCDFMLKVAVYNQAFHPQIALYASHVMSWMTRFCRNSADPQAAQPT